MSHYDELLPAQFAPLNIVDFGQIDREIITPKDFGLATLGDKREKESIKTIVDLRKILAAIVSVVCDNIRNSNVYAGEFEINDHFIHQLVFDILYDRYLEQSPHMTLGEYCRQLDWFKWDNEYSTENDGFANAQKTAKKFIYEELKFEDTRKRHETLRSDAELFGINPDRYNEYLDCVKSLNIGYSTDNKKPKYTWDHLYYNGNRKLITYKQYRRNFQTGKHYLYDHFARDYNTYDGFVKKFMLEPGDSAHVCFIKAMDFYHLEIYKRLDFIYKLAVRMEAEGIKKICRSHPLIKRFHPLVQYYYVNDGALRCSLRAKYYRPFFFVEKICPETNAPLAEQQEGLLFIHYTIRAKSYEMFNYKFKFTADDYADIWGFVSKCFDVLSYHDSEKEWFNNSAQKYGDQLMRIKNAEVINNTLFWESEAKKKPAR